jgi:hypothetical protein
MVKNKIKIQSDAPMQKPSSVFPAQAINALFFFC